MVRPASAPMSVSDTAVQPVSLAYPKASHLYAFCETTCLERAYPGVRNRPSGTFYDHERAGSSLVAAQTIAMTTVYSSIPVLIPN